MITKTIKEIRKLLEFVDQARSIGLYRDKKMLANCILQIGKEADNIGAVLVDQISLFYYPDTWKQPL